MSNLIKYHRLTSKRIFLETGKLPAWFKKPRETNLLLSYPFWVTKEMLKPFIAEVKRKNLETGIQHSIDHIIPIRHPLVCGLSVPANLRVIPAKQGERKGNQFCPDSFNLSTKFKKKVNSNNR